MFSVADPDVFNTPKPRSRVREHNQTPKAPQKKSCKHASMFSAEKTRKHRYEHLRGLVDDIARQLWPDEDSVKIPEFFRFRKNVVFNTPRRSCRVAQRADQTPNAPQKKSLKLFLLSSAVKRRLVRRFDRHEHFRLQDGLSRALWLHADFVKPPETILAKLQEFRKTYRTASFKNDEKKVDDTILQVVDMSPREVTEKIKYLRRKVRKNGFPVPSRTKGSQKFSVYHDAWVQERRKDFMRVKKNATTNENNELYKVTYELVTRIYKLCSNLTSMKLREVYYSNTKLFKSTITVNVVIDDICCMIGCTRSSLLTFADEKGVVYGDIDFDRDEHKYNGLAGGFEGIHITSDTRSIRNINSKGALFILVVEKDTIFERLAQDGFCKKYHCIMVTAKGMPDVATRSFLRKIRDELKLPVFALVDFNPYGLRIYSVYRYGSKALCYDSENLTTPDIELLGIRYNDLKYYEIPEESIEQMTEDDIMTAQDLLALDFMNKYHEDLHFMLREKKKIQIEALYTHGVEYFAEVALPLMLDRKLSQLNEEYILECEI